MDDDPVIARIRKARHRISEEFGHDPKRLVGHYVKLQERIAIGSLVHQIVPPTKGLDAIGSDT